MEIKVILVEPLYQINLGYAARTLMNFGIKRMNIVSPRCKYDGKEAIKYSKHAAALLKSARVYSSIESASKDADLVVGTTGLWRKSDRAFFNVYYPDSLKRMTQGKKRIALLIGRDDTGLKKEELQMCDANVFIPTSDDYPVLNISHALAIMLYELTKNEFKGGHEIDKMRADEGAIDGIVKLFWKSIEKRGDIRDKKAVLMAFKHIVSRSSPTRKELSALAVGLSGKYKEKETKKNKKK